MIWGKETTKAIKQVSEGGREGGEEKKVRTPSD